MIECLHVLVIVHRPLLLRLEVRHPELLALVDEGRAGLEPEEEGEQLCACDAVDPVVVCEATDGSRLVVVLQV